MRTKINIKTIVILLWMTISPQLLFSQCVTPFEAGNWINMDNATGGITRVKVDFSCNDVIVCGIDANGNVTCSTPSPPYTMHLWGKCNPSDCDWRAVPGNDYRTSDGIHWIYAFYDQGFAKRYVYIKPSSLYPGNLYMWMYTNFTDPARADYISTNWFRR